MYAVTGATGQLGRLAVEALLAKAPADQVVALVRDPAKAADLAARGVVVRQADYDRPETLTPALAGVKKLLFISGSEIGKRAVQHAAVIDAAKAAGVELIAYTSILHAPTSPIPLVVEHRATEKLLADSGVPHILLRNGWYTENYVRGLDAALAQGVLEGASGDGRISPATRADFAGGAVAALLGGKGGDVHELAGDDSFTKAEFVAEVSRQSGKPFVYRNLTEAEYAGTLEAAGFPGYVATTIAGSDAAIGSGTLFDDGKALSRLLGRPTTPWKQVVANALAG